MAKKKLDSKTFAAQKRGRRRLLTFFRIIKYGVDNFVRNSWLSVAATAVMTITLLIILVVGATRVVLTDTVSELSNKIDMSIYLKTDTTNEVGADLSAKIKELSSVRAVTYISAEEARANMAQLNENDQSFLSALNEATNRNPATLRVVVKDINDTTQLEKFVETNISIKEHLSDDYKPSFAGDRREVIKSIGRAVNFIQQIGVIVGAVFVVISSLIIFNTISMAIFNRKEEIQMMKLIGADKSFIRGPFLIEAIIYGVIAAVIATGLGVWGLFSVADTLASYEIAIQPVLDLVKNFAAIGLLGIGMVVIGSVIGIISSLFATRRYLKI